MRSDRSILKIGAAALEKSRLLPFSRQTNHLPIACGNCNFINNNKNNFCTNCGYPVKPDEEKIALYESRLAKRKSLQKRCSIKVEQARNALYVVAGCSMLGVFYVFSGVKQTEMTGMVMIFLGLIYAGLGKWSLQKPFTALLISLITMLTFTAINTSARFSSMFTSAGGYYMLVVQLILIYFLLRGVKGAFHADILEEDFKL